MEDVVKITDNQSADDPHEDVVDSENKELHKKNGKLQLEMSEKATDMLYGVDDKPPWYLCLVLGFQHYLMMLSGLISIPYLLAPSMCIADDNPARGHMLSTIMLVGGLSTILQTTYGSRLPIVQGGTFALIIPAIAILEHPDWKCDSSPDKNLTMTDPEEFWMRRMREIQGSVLVAGVFEMFLGLSGLVGLLLRFITPLAIAPTIALIGLSTFKKTAELASTNWAISVATVVLFVLFSQYLQETNVPMPSYQRKVGCRITKYPLFKVFSVLLTIFVMWTVSAILTVSGVFAENSLARTDRKMNLLYRMQWFRVPYPGQWGLPTVSPGSVLGMMAGVTASIVESIGDYYACARISAVPVPPRHAMNRGIGVEGFGCILGGIWGSGNGTTSYSQNIAALGITKVASLRVVQCCAALMIIFAVFGKFGALFVTIPEPIVGGIFCVLFGMVTSVGFSNLHSVNLQSTRNIFILGFSLFMGLAIPGWIGGNKTSIKSGSDDFDQIVVILLSTPMFVAGFLGVLLDNTIPGNARDLLHHEPPQEDYSGECQGVSYDFPYGMAWVRRSNFMRYVPVSPTYERSPFTFSRPTFKRVKSKPDKDEIDDVLEKASTNNYKTSGNV